MENISAIMTLLILYTALFLLTSAIGKLRPGINRYQRVLQSNFWLLNVLHGGGSIIMLLPFFLIKQLPVDLLSFPDKISLWQALAFLGCFALIALIPWKKANGGSNGTETISFSPRYRILSYVIIRLSFLATYEWFFRGLLLTAFCEWLGTIGGILSNLILYVLIHAHKGKKELIGCLPLGIVLCAFTLWWGSVWPAIIFHVQIAFLNEWPRLQQFFSPQKQTAV